MRAARRAIGVVALAALSSCAGAPERAAPRRGPPAARAPVPRRAVEIAAGRLHTCARADDRTVFCWGNGAAGQLGRAAGNDALTPVQVPDLTDAVGVRAAGFATCVLRRAGVDACFGLSPAAARQASSSGDEARGLDHVCLLAAGRVSCRGDGSFDQLGDATTGHDDLREVAGLDDATAIAAGLVHTCALRASGAVACWGGNDFGQVGDGTRASRPRPFTIELPPR